MIFSFLLWFAAWQIRLKLFFARRKNPSIIDEFLENDIILQIQTQDKKSLRCYVISKHGFNSFSTASENPSLTVTFPDGKTAKNIISAVRKDKSQVFTFIQEQKFTMEGDFSILQKLFALKEKIDGNSASNATSNSDIK